MAKHGQRTLTVYNQWTGLDSFFSHFGTTSNLQYMTSLLCPELFWVEVKNLPALLSWFVVLRTVIHVGNKFWTLESTKTTTCTCTCRVFVPCTCMLLIVLALGTQAVNIHTCTCMCVWYFDVSKCVGVADALVLTCTCICICIHVSKCTHADVYTLGRDSTLVCEKRV